MKTDLGGRGSCWKGLKCLPFPGPMGTVKSGFCEGHAVLGLCIIGCPLTVLSRYSPHGWVQPSSQAPKLPPSLSLQGHTPQGSPGSVSQPPSSRGTIIRHSLMIPGEGPPAQKRPSRHSDCELSNCPCTCFPTSSSPPPRAPLLLLETISPQNTSPQVLASGSASRSPKRDQTQMSDWHRTTGSSGRDTGTAESQQRSFLSALGRAAGLFCAVRNSNLESPGGTSFH